MMDWPGIPLADRVAENDSPPWSAWVDNIRILVVHPAQRYESPVICNLVQGIDHFRYVEGQSDDGVVGLYEALSYCWGDSTTEIPIIVDGHERRITENLDVALRHLRRDNGYRHLWVDALCIDQSDTKDKNKIVPLMNKIYELASGTIIWIGAASPDSELAISALEQEGKNWDQDSPPEHFLRGYFEETELAAIDCPENRWKWDAMANLARRPWWSRTWVMQEVALSRRYITLRCGYRCGDWYTILNGVRSIRRKIQALVAHRPEMRSLGNLLNALDMTKTENIFRALLRSRPTMAKDPRDKVYGVLHLAHDEKPNDIRIDYNYSVVEVYTATTRYLLNSTHDLGLLALNDLNVGLVEERLGLTHRRTDNLPSWVIDWADQRVLSSMPAAVCAAMTSMPDVSPYRATGHPAECTGEGDQFVTKSSQMNFAWTPKLSELLVQGILLTQVEHLGPCLDHTQSDQDKLLPLMKFVMDTMPMCTDKGPGNDRLPKRRLSLEVQHEYDVMLRCLTCNRKPCGQNLDRPLHFPRDINDHETLYNIGVRSHDRQLFRTTSGMLGLARKDVQISDLIALVLGCPVPLILRRVSTSIHNERQGRYSIIGIAYIDGIMEGELTNAIGSGPGKSLHPEDILLV